MPKIDEGVINYAVYENDNELIGMSDVTMPDLTSITQTISGAGIAGNVEVSYRGNFDVMTMTMNFRTTTAASVDLSKPGLHTIELRAAIQYEDSESGTVSTHSIKHIMRVLHKKTGGGSISPNSPENASGEYSVRYWATYIDGKRLREIDQFNFICFIDGNDYLAEVRKALGRA